MPVLLREASCTRVVGDGLWPLAAGRMVPLVQPGKYAVTAVCGRRYCSSRSSCPCHMHACTDKHRLIGGSAKIHGDPCNTVFDAKRMIGRKFHDSMVQADMKHWPFSVEEGKEGKPVVRVRHLGMEKKLTPEEVRHRA